MTKNRACVIKRSHCKDLAQVLSAETKESIDVLHKILENCLFVLKTISDDTNEPFSTFNKFGQHLSEHLDVVSEVNEKLTMYWKSYTERDDPILPNDISGFTATNVKPYVEIEVEGTETDVIHSDWENLDKISNGTIDLQDDVLCDANIDLTLPECQPIYDIETSSSINLGSNIGGDKDISLKTEDKNLSTQDSFQGNYKLWTNCAINTTNIKEEHLPLAVQNSPSSSIVSNSFKAATNLCLPNNKYSPASDTLLSLLKGDIYSSETEIPFPGDPTSQRLANLTSKIDSIKKSQSESKTEKTQTWESTIELKFSYIAPNSVEVPEVIWWQEIETQPALPESRFLAVDICYFVDGVSFFAHLTKCKSQWRDLSEHIDQLAKQLPALNERPCKKQILIAKYEDDGRWYRARVINSAPGSCFVNFFDYGNEHSVNLMDAKLYPRHLTNTPPFAYKCVLNGIKPRTESCLGQFIKLCQNQSLRILIERDLKDGGFAVNLLGFDTLQKREFSIGDELVRRGHAVKSH